MLEGEHITQGADTVDTDKQDDKITDTAATAKADVNVDDLVSGWQEDRARLAELERENFELKRSKSSKTEDDDEDLTIDERVEKRIREKEEQAQALKERDTKAAEREVNFMRRTNATFRNNEQSVLQIAIDAKVNLTEATKIFKERQIAVKEAQDKANDTKKKDADQKPGSSSKGTVGKKGYDPQVDGKKSIGDLYREAL